MVIREGGGATIAEINYETGAGGNGNPFDRFFLTGSDWASGETIAANSITVDGNATTHAAVTVDSNLRWGPILVTITAAITTTGEKDVIVTGSVTGATTFADSFLVLPGAGLNDLYKFGDIRDKELSKDVLAMAIETAIEDYYGRMRGIISTDDLPHAQGNFPEVARKIVAYLAVAILYESFTGTDDGMEKAEKWQEKAENDIMMMRQGKKKMRNPDLTWVVFINRWNYQDVAKNDFELVTEYNDDGYSE
jgi:hypothetical protein